MIYFIFASLGILVLFWGSIRLLTVLKELQESMWKFENLSSETGVANLAQLRNELDELNYSYYELLANYSERMDALEQELNKIQWSNDLSSTFTGATIDQKSSAINEQVKQIERFDKPEKSVKHDKPSVSHQTTDQSERNLTLKLIEQGYSNQDIARILNIGVGKVDMLRRIEEHKLAKG